MLNMGQLLVLLDLGYRQEANLEQISGSHLRCQLRRFLPGREIGRLWVGGWYDKDLGYDGWVVEDPCNRCRCWGFRRGY